MRLQEALMLFHRLGIDVPSLTPREFFAAYCRLAKRYHPDAGYQGSNELMANINAARAVVLATYYRGKAHNDRARRERVDA